MSLITDTTFAKWKTRLQFHLELPLYRNAYLLMLNTLSSAVLGILYWILAARLYSPGVVGNDSLAISTMIFVTSIAGLNLSVGFIRFIPNMRHEIYRILTLSYLVVIGLTFVCVSGLIALNAVGIVKLSFLGVDPAFTIWYVVACLLWAVFGLQDAALTGLREAKWVPIENGVYGIVKMLMLILLAGAHPASGIFISWSVPVIGAIIFINYLMLRRLIPRHIARLRSDLPPMKWGEVLRYSVIDFMGSFFWIVLVSMMPYMVSLMLGEQMTGYFYIAWTAASVFQFMTNGMSTSFTVEGAHDRSQLYPVVRRVLRQLFWLLIPALFLGFVAAPVVLRLYGDDYAANSTVVFQLLALGVIPFSINTLFVSISRVQRRLGRVIVMEAALCFITLGLALILAKPMGINGVGLAYLTGQTVVAAALLLTSMRHVFIAPLSNAE